MREYEYSPLVKVQGWSEAPRGEQLFDSIVVFENYPVDKMLSERCGEVEVKQTRGFERAKYGVTVSAAAADRLMIKLGYDGGKYDGELMRQMGRHLERLLEEMVEREGREVRELRMLSDEESHQLLVGWNQTQRDYPHCCIHHLITEQAHRIPEAVAIISGDSELTYRELDERANQLAHYLRGQGVGVESRVGVCLDHSIELVVALLGALKAGAAYVPLDPAHPTQRLQWIIGNAALQVAITNRDLQTLVADYLPTVCIDREWEIISRLDKQAPQVQLSPENLAYVIYTSGSTGWPKGVMITHRAICNRLLWDAEEFPLTEEDAVLQTFSFSFDISVWEIFAPLCGGARLVIVPSGMRADGSYQVRLISECGVTSMSVIPSMLDVLLDNGLAQCASLRQVFSGAELLSVKLRQVFSESVNAILHNFYGLTETSLDATIWTDMPGSHQEIIPVGKPIGNMKVYILDSELRLVPAGVPGEIYIGGDGLARGYINRVEDTAERFIPDLYSMGQGERLYKTGDLGKYLPDGNIVFIGRNDHQIKIRGYRVELPEIERVLSEHASIEEAIVLPLTNNSESVKLVAYIAARNPEDLSVEDLRKFLKSTLPSYMLPSAWVVLDNLPKLSNGKVDRKALETIDKTNIRSDTEYVAPRNAIEEMVVRIWMDILKLDQVSIYDRFFDLGGHSLLVVQLISRLREEFQVEVPMIKFFNSMHTVVDLAQLIEEQQIGESADDDLLQTLNELSSLSDSEVEVLLKEDHFQKTL
jgi:microcystin synthetase protein McyB